MGKRRFVAFDIETSTVVPNGQHWRESRPLGIACIGSWCDSEDETRVWTTRGVDGQPAQRMGTEDLASFVGYLCEQMESGVIPLTWNGLFFDFDILAEESGMRDECKRLARHHVDMMFHVFCVLGYRVGLDKAARAMGLGAKLSGIDGRHVPKLWQAGKFQAVQDYLKQDVVLTAKIAEHVDSTKNFCWFNSKGDRKCKSIATGWKIVDDALRIPAPDTSWMNKPIRRSEFIAWMQA